MTDSKDTTYAAGRRDGLSKALEIIDDRLGPEHLQGLQPDEFRQHLFEITEAIRNEVAATVAKG